MTGGPPGRRLRAVPVHPSAVDQAQTLASYAETFLICREQHALPLGSSADHWRDDRDDRGVLHGWRRTLMCERCHAIATDVLDPTGKMTRAWRYPEGYRIPRDVGGYVSRRDVRLERVRRVHDQVAGVG